MIGPCSQSPMPAEMSLYRHRHTIENLFAGQRSVRRRRYSLIRSCLLLEHLHYCDHTPLSRPLGAESRAHGRDGFECRCGMRHGESIRIELR